MILHKIVYKEEPKTLEGIVNDIYRKAVQLGTVGEFEVEFKTCSKNARQILDPRVFYFRQNNKANLMDIRASVGKELTRRNQDPNFNNYRVTISGDSPTNPQRGYYYGTILPFIQNHFTNEGNHIKEKELDDIIRSDIENEEGLTAEEINPINGNIYKSRITMSNAGNMADSCKYIDAVIRWAAKEGCVVPECKMIES